MLIFKYYHRKCKKKGFFSAQRKNTIFSTDECLIHKTQASIVYFVTKETRVVGSWISNQSQVSCEFWTYAYDIKIALEHGIRKIFC